MRIQPSFTSNSYDNAHNNKAYIVTAPQAFSQAQKKNHTIRDIGLFTGIALVSFGAFKGIRHILNTPPKSVAELIENKSAEIDSVIVKARSGFVAQLSKATSELSTVFAKPIESTQEVADLTNQINKAHSLNELMQIEDSCFIQSNSCFNKNLNANKKTPEELAEKYTKIVENLKQKVNPLEQDALEQIKTKSEIPNEIQIKWRAKNAIKSFKFDANEAKRTIQESKDDAIEFLQNEGQALFREYNNYSSSTVANKNERSQNILASVQQKLDHFLSTSTPVKIEINQNVNLNIIPATVPQSILNNKFYQFASNMDANKLESSIPDFVQNMDEKLSIKDVQILIQRMELRQKAGIGGANEGSWYSNKLKQLKDCETKISAFLENSFYNSGKKLDANNLTLEQENTIIYSLQQHSKKMGFATVVQMVNHFAAGDMSTDGEQCVERMKHFEKSPMSKLYPKINNKINDFSRLLSQ